MADPLSITASPPVAAAIGAVHDLLGRLKMDHLFVGSIGEAAWTGDFLMAGPVDVLAAATPERKGQIPMMASNRGFEVDREAVEAADELDLVPLGWDTDGVRVRIHVLLASNALYGRMFTTPVECRLGELDLRVPAAGDVVLMMIVGERPQEHLDRILEAAGDAVDRDTLNQKLRSVGLERSVIQ